MHKNAFTYALLFLIVSLLIFFVLPGSEADSSSIVRNTGFLVFGVTIIVLALRWNSLLNPFVYLCSIVVYYIPSLIYINNLSDLTGVTALGWLLCISVGSFWLAFCVFGSAKFERCGRRLFSGSQLRLSNSALSLAIVCALVAEGLLQKYAGSMNLTIKGIAFLFRDATSILVFAFILEAAMRSRKLFLFGILAYFTTQVTCSYYILSDSSRFELVLTVVLIVGGCYLRSKGRLIPIRIAYVLVVIFACCAFFYTVRSATSLVSRLGGDVLILENSLSIVNAVDRSHGALCEPFMFGYNLGLYAVPPSLWPFGAKPKMYNPSAWLLSNVLDLNPGVYPWGVGVGGVGASYLYGRVVAVVLIYFTTGAFFAFMVRRVATSFLFGVYFRFLSLLPFAMYRMDESFLYGFAITFIPFVLYLFLKRNKWQRKLAATICRSSRFAASEVRTVATSYD